MPISLRNRDGSLERVGYAPRAGGGYEQRPGGTLTREDIRQEAINRGRSAPSTPPPAQEPTPPPKTISERAAQNPDFVASSQRGEYEFITATNTRASPNASVDNGFLYKERASPSQTTETVAAMVARKTRPLAPSLGNNPYTKLRRDLIQTGGGSIATKGRQASEAVQGFYTDVQSKAPGPTKLLFEPAIATTKVATGYFSEREKYPSLFAVDVASLGAGEFVGLGAGKAAAYGGRALQKAAPSIAPQAIRYAGTAGAIAAVGGGAYAAYDAAKNPEQFGRYGLTELGFFVGAGKGFTRAIGVELPVTRRGPSTYRTREIAPPKPQGGYAVTVTESFKTDKGLKSSASISAGQYRAEPLPRKLAFTSEAPLVETSRVFGEPVTRRGTEYRTALLTQKGAGYEGRLDIYNTLKTGKRGNIQPATSYDVYGTTQRSTIAARRINDNALYAASSRQREIPFGREIYVDPLYRERGAVTRLNPRTGAATYNRPFSATTSGFETNTRVRFTQYEYANGAIKGYTLTKEPLKTRYGEGQSRYAIATPEPRSGYREAAFQAFRERGLVARERQSIFANKRGSLTNQYQTIDLSLTSRKTYAPRGALLAELPATQLEATSLGGFRGGLLAVSTNRLLSNLGTSKSSMQALGTFSSLATLPSLKQFQSPGISQLPGQGQYTGLGQYQRVDNPQPSPPPSSILPPPSLPPPPEIPRGGNFGGFGLPLLPAGGFFNDATNPGRGSRRRYRYAASLAALGAPRSRKAPRETYGIGIRPLR